MRTYILAMLIVALMIGGCLGSLACPDTNEPVCGSDGKTYNNPCLARQAGITNMQAGACGSGCSDSDGGRDIFSAASATDQSGTYDDECVNALTVEERFCEGGSAASKEIPCPAGYECAEGACGPVQCIDSDGGEKPDVKGTVTVAGKDQADSCADKLTVKEYYCDGSQAVSKEMKCAAGKECVSGACVEAQCADSDKGKNTSVAGTATKGGESSADSCYDTRSVTEYYCENGDIKSQKIACGPGFECQKGKCVEAKCEDSDGGKDQFAKGTTTYGNESKTDSCYSDTSVLEYYCSSDTAIAYDRLSCGSGHECFDGNCRRIACDKIVTDVDDVDMGYLMQEYDDGDQLTMYVGDAVEINDGMILKLQGVSGTDATFRLFMDYEAFADNDYECSTTIAEGDVDSDLCGENTDDVEVVTVDDTDDYAEVILQEYYAAQYYTLQGVVTDWTDNPTCPDDEERYDRYVAEFLPYMDTDPAGLDLEGRKFKLFGKLARIDDIDSNSIDFTLDGEDYSLDDGDTFEYMDEEYDVTLDFGDGGLERMELELS